MQNNRTNLTVRLPTTVALLLSLAGCATQDVGRVVQAPCPQLPEPPSNLRLKPPTADFQLRLRSFFLSSPEKPIEQPSTPRPVTSGSGR